MSDAFYILEKYNPFRKRWEFLNSNKHNTLEEAQDEVSSGWEKDDYKLRIVKVLMSIVEDSNEVTTRSVEGINNMSDYVKIIAVLEEVADMEINLGSKAGREFLAQKIMGAIDTPLSRDLFIKSYEELTDNHE